MRPTLLPVLITAISVTNVSSKETITASSAVFITNQIDFWLNSYQFIYKFIYQFKGCCIGYKNFRYYFGKSTQFLFEIKILLTHRYYYGLLIYIAIGGCYATILNQFFIWQALGGFNWFTILNHFLPFPFWLMGKVSFPVCIYTFISIIDLCGFLFALGLLYYHGMLLINNQTTYEKNKSITQYSLGNWKSNVLENLGPNWLPALLFSPLISSPLPRNGIDFPSIKENKLNSNKSKWNPFYILIITEVLNQNQWSRKARHQLLYN